MTDALFFARGIVRDLFKVTKKGHYFLFVYKNRKILMHKSLFKALNKKKMSLRQVEMVLNNNEELIMYL